MLNITFILGALALLASFEAAAESAPVLTSFRQEGAASGPKIYSRLSLFTSRSGNKTDFRTMRTLGTDESGSVSEKSIFPNMNFASALVMVTPARGHQLAVAGLQSMDAVAKRTLPTPMGKSVIIPGRIAAVRYRYDLSQKFALSAAGVHVDTYGFSDPSFGLTYLTFDSRNRMYRFGLNQTAPITKSSRSAHLLSKSTLRASVVARKDEWVTTGYISHSRPFYAAGASPENAATQVTVTRASPLPDLQEMDIVILQKEKNRSTGSVTTAFVKKAFTFSASASASYFHTIRDRNIWSTTIKPLGIAYTSKKKWETGASFNLTSAAEKFRAPSLPSQWNVGVYLSYSIGDLPAI